MRTFAAVVAVIVMMTAGCTRVVQIEPAALEDARLGVRVKTALVNDAQLGPRVIEVRVTDGVVTLSGLVGSTDEADRAISLAQRVPGVSKVRSQLMVATASELQTIDEDSSPVARQVPVNVATPGSARNRRIAVGASIGRQHPTNERLDSNMTLGPMVRIGVGRGLGFGLGFSWFRTDLSSADTADTLGRITIRPVMAGLNYTLNDQTRWALSLSMVAGLAFNSFTFQESTVRDGLALDVANSFAMRPGVSLWYDINSRVAFNAFGGYVVTRPRTTFLEDGQFVRRAVRADAAVLSVGLAYKLF